MHLLQSDLCNKGQYAETPTYTQDEDTMQRRRSRCGSEIKKREEEWKAKMKKKEDELQDKDNKISKLHLELVKEKKAHDNTKKELYTINQLNLLSRKRSRFTNEIKGEYIEEEDVKVKREANENAEEDGHNNIESPRYSQKFFRREPGQY